MVRLSGGFCRQVRCRQGSGTYKFSTPPFQGSAFASSQAGRRSTSSSTRSAHSSESSAWDQWSPASLAQRKGSRRRSFLVPGRAKTRCEKRFANTKQAVTLGKLIPVYLRDREPDFRSATYIEVSRYLERYWQPLHEVTIEAVQRRDIVRVLDMIADEHGKVSADRARTALSAFFAWAIDRAYLDLNPVQNIARRAQGAARTRTLSESELVEVWKACIDDDHGRIVRLLILTGQRKSEMGDLVASEVIIDKRQIELPESRTKNGRAHIVSLSDEAMSILSAIPQQENRDQLFGQGSRGYQGWSKAKAALDERIANARVAAGLKPMPPWTVHDIRRSVVTHLHERGFAQPHVVEALVNHVSGHTAGVAGVYNKAQYLPERRRAIDLWGQHIAGFKEDRRQRRPEGRTMTRHTLSRGMVPNPLVEIEEAIQSLPALEVPHPNAMHGGMQKLYFTGQPSPVPLLDVILKIKNIIDCRMPNQATIDKLADLAGIPPDRRSDFAVRLGSAVLVAWCPLELKGSSSISRWSKALQRQLTWPESCKKNSRHWMARP